MNTAVEETAMVTDLRKICDQFSDDNIKVIPTNAFISVQILDL